MRAMCVVQVGLIVHTCAVGRNADTFLSDVVCLFLAPEKQAGRLLAGCEQVSVCLYDVWNFR